MSEIAELLADRTAQYGARRHNAACTRRLYALTLGTDTELTHIVLETLHMLAHKTARIYNGKGDAEDSLKDILGYIDKSIEEIKAYVERPSGDDVWFACRSHARNADRDATIVNELANMFVELSGFGIVSKIDAIDILERARVHAQSAYDRFLSLKEG